MRLRREDPSISTPPARATSPASTTKKKMQIIEAPEIRFPTPAAPQQGAHPTRAGNSNSGAIACSGAGVLASGIMTRNTALRETIPVPDTIAGRSIVLVGLMGAGKTSIGRRLAARLGLPFRDADQEIELAAGCTIPELFARYGEPAFRDGERRVIRRLLAGDPMVLAFGGGAFMDRRPGKPPGPRRCPSGCAAPCRRWSAASPTRDNRPLLNGRDRERNPARTDGPPLPDLRRGRRHRRLRRRTAGPYTTGVMNALLDWKPARRLHVVLPSTSYDVVIGDNLLARAGALLAPRLPQKRAVVITDRNVAGLHLQTLLDGLAQTAIAASLDRRQGRRGSKSMDTYLDVVDQLLEARVERRPR